MLEFVNHYVNRQGRRIPVLICGDFNGVRTDAVSIRSGLARCALCVAYKLRALPGMPQQELEHSITSKQDSWQLNSLSCVRVMQVGQLLESQGFISAYDEHTCEDGDEPCWVSHVHRDGSVQGVDFQWLLNPSAMV